MTSLVGQALGRIATAAMRDQAAEILYLDASGHTNREIAKAIGVKTTEVPLIRDATGDCMIDALRESGYADIDIQRTLGVPSARVAAAV